MANKNKNKAKAPVAEAKQTDTAIEAEIVTEAVETVTEEDVATEATTPADEAEVTPESEETVPAVEDAVEDAVEAEAEAEVQAGTVATQGIAGAEQAAAISATPAGLPIVSHNSTLVEWPTDTWGFTTELKAAIINVASRVQGAADKKLMVDQVFNIGRAHLEAKFAIDSSIREAAIAAAIADNEAKEAEVEAPAQTELF